MPYKLKMRLNQSNTLTNKWYTVIILKYKILKIVLILPKNWDFLINYHYNSITYSNNCKFAPNIIEKVIIFLDIFLIFLKIWRARNIFVFKPSSSALPPPFQNLPKWQVYLLYICHFSKDDFAPFWSILLNVTIY